MTDPLQVTPDELRKTAEHLAEVSANLRGVLSKLQGKLAAAGEPWSDDKTGQRFADGPEGYLAQRDWVNGSITAKADLLDQYVGQLKDTADSVQQLDEG